MSRVAYFDCASGASGDMLLGALVDLGLPLDALRDALAKLPLGGFRLEARPVLRSGLRATKVDVIVDAAAEPTAAAHAHDHAQGHAQHAGRDQGHAHRGLREILDMIDRSGLEPSLKQRSVACFRRLAEAEAAVHGTSPEAVHFHEVGAVDSIVDVVGGLCGLSWLRAARFVASPLNVGSGTVAISHGTFSVPAPATARLVLGVPVYGAGEGELLTPTGALLVTEHAASYGPLPPLRPEAIGHGAGTRDTAGRPNVLRLIVGEETGAPDAVDRVLVLETEVDDMSPQLCEPLLTRLLVAGALDVFYTPIHMKKGRPGLLLTCLAAPDKRHALEEILFSESTTLGVRRQEWERSVLERESVTVDTPYGAIGVKLGRRGQRIYNVQPEFDDCQRAAAERGVPVKEVWAAALAAYRTGRSAR